MGGLVVSQIMLWVLVVALSLVCLALTRQLGLLHERIAPMGALALNRRLNGGSQAPVVSARTLSGTPITVGASRESSQSSQCQLVFFLSPTCPVCKGLLPVLQSIRERENGWLLIILASDGGEIDSHRSFVRQHRIDGFPYVLSEQLGMAYGVSRLPYAVLIDEKGIVTALGLVNSREQIESLFEARRLGQSTLQKYLAERDVHRREPAEEEALSSDEFVS